MKLKRQPENVFASLKPELLKMSSYYAGENSLKYIEEKIFKVITENAQLTGHNGFWFKQEYFGSTIRGTPTKDHLLHKSLKDEMEKLHVERSLIMSDLAKATMYCKFALRCAPSLAEYISLLPDEFGKTVRIVIEKSTGMICASVGYPPEFVEAFKAKYSEEEKALRNQLVYNLLQG